MDQLVIGVLNQPFRRKILPELLLLQEEGLVRVVDQLFVSKAPDGQVSIQEVSDLCGEDCPAYEALAVDLRGWLTKDERAIFAGELSPNTEAVLLLLEYRGTVGLTKAVRQGGGVNWFGERVPCQVLQLIGAALARAQQEYAS